MLKHKKPKGKDEGFKRDLRALRARRQKGTRKNSPYDPKQYDQKHLEG